MFCTISGTMPEQVMRIAAHVRHGKNVSSHVVIGPLVWQPKGDDRFWYFVIASGAGKRARFDQIGSPHKELAEDCRLTLPLGVAQTPGILIHILDDELQMARLCEALWPSARTRRIRSAIQTERAAASAKVPA